MSQFMKDKLVELGLSEAKADKFLEDTEVRNRQIESENLIRRGDGDASDTTKNDEVETEVEAEELEQEVEIDVEQLFPALEGHISGLVNTILDEKLGTVRTTLKELTDALEKSKNRIAELEKEDVEKVQKAVDDLPESRKGRKIIFRPSEGKLRDQQTGEEIEDNGIDVQSQIKKMQEARNERMKLNK